MLNTLNHFLFRRDIQSLIYSIFIIFFFITYLQPGLMPGDNGDGKSVLGNLESLFNIISQEKSNLTKRFHLYAFKDTLFFSDPMLGVGWIYCFFRFLKLDPFLSYKLLFLITFLLNFFVCFYCCRKLEISYSSNLLVSTLFTFGLPVIAHDSHYILLARFYVPACIYLIYSYFLDRNNYKFILFFFLFFLQLITSIYISIFLVIVSLVTFFVLIYKKKKLFFKDLKNEINIFFKNLTLLQSTLIILILFLLIIFCFNYIKVLSLYNFSRGYDSKGLINLFSFIHTDRSIFWTNNWIPDGYAKIEHQLYLGISIILLLLICFIYREILYKYEKISDFFKISFFSILLFTSFFGLSFYLILQYFPGVSSLRHGTRLILVILFPLSVFIGLSIDKILNIKKNYSLIIFLISLFFLIELASARKVTTNINAEFKRNKDYIEFFEKASKDEILVFKNDTDDPNYILNEFDLSFLSNFYGIKTLNGWSSYIPGNYHPLNSCEKVAQNLENIKNFYKKNNKYYEFKKNNLTFVGFDKDCKI